MINEFGSRLGLICVVTLIQSCLAHPDLPKVSQIQSALDGGSTRPTWEMVYGAVQEWMDWNGRVHQGYRESNEINLIRDSVLLPFKMHAESTPVNKRGRFLDKLFATYKLFWPHYVANKEIPGGSVETPSCVYFYEAVIDEQKRKQLTIEDFRKAVERFGYYKYTIGSITQYGSLPSRRSEAAAIYNAVTKYKILFMTWWSVRRMPEYERESVTIDEIVKIFDEEMEKVRIFGGKQEREQAQSRWKILVEYRQRQSEEAANRLREIEEEEKPRQVKRRNNPNPRGRAGPSGHS